MRSRHFLAHLLLAAFISFGISTAVWLLLDIFNPVGFVVVSTGAALFGALAGWTGGKYLATTVATTILLRGAVLFFAIGG